MNEELEYCDAIYKRFVERRAHSLMLTVRDWEQILTWQERDIPLALVLRVIDRHVEHAEGEGRPLRLTELAPLVRGALLDLRKSEVGKPQETEEEAATFSMAFVLARLLEPAAERLRAELRPDASGAAAAEVLGHAIGRLRRRQLTAVSTEQLLSWEGRVNRKMLEAAERAAEPELLEQAKTRAEAAASTASPRAAEVLRTKIYHLVLRRLLGVPRLRLFAGGG